MSSLSPLNKGYNDNNTVINAKTRLLVPLQTGFFLLFDDIVVLTVMPAINYALL
jgi:hypothetical protein